MKSLAKFSQSWRSDTTRRRILDSYIFVLDEIHRHLLVERDRLARQVFHDMLADGTMRFMVVTDEFVDRKGRVQPLAEVANYFRA